MTREEDKGDWQDGGSSGSKAGGVEVGGIGGRGRKLEESIIYQQFLAKIEEEEAWISEKQQLLTVPDLGDNMAAVQGLLKKHDAFETDISVHGDR